MQRLEVSQRVASRARSPWLSDERWPGAMYWPAALSFGGAVANQALKGKSSYGNIAVIIDNTGKPELRLQGTWM